MESAIIGASVWIPISLSSFLKKVDMMKTTNRLLRVCVFAALLLLFAVSVCEAQVRTSGVFSSNMVLQRDAKVRIWGWAAAGENVTVSISERESKTKADEKGFWLVTLEPLAAGGPWTLLIKGEKSELKYENVLIGDVWLCSGQSNMEWTMNSSADSRADIPQAARSRIRLFQAPHVWKRQPQENIDATWTECTPETVTRFSAIAFYFGDVIQKDLDVPVGLINTSWGGTRIEPWTPPVGFDAVATLESIAHNVAAKNPETKIHKELVTQTLGQYKSWISATEKALAETQVVSPPPRFPDALVPFDHHQEPTVLYNAMVHPFVPMTLKGFLWYQGESNRGEGMLYAEKKKALILGWRNVFQDDSLAFYFVQLAPFNYGNSPEALAEIWEAQAAVEKEVPHTGMAVINDIGNLKDIHPDKKSVVGARLAKLALNRTYGKKDISSDYPEAGFMKLDGDSLVLYFQNAKSLKTRDGKSPDWFEIAGADGVYQKAEASIEGTTIRLKSEKVKKPCVVRFAWDMLAEPNLQNEAGLPAGAFRLGEIPERGTFDEHVPDAEKFKVLYSFDPTHPVLTDNNRRLTYTVDNSTKIVGKIKRVGYYLYLTPREGTPQYVFVTMPPLSQDLKKLGVPTKASGARFQQRIENVTVASNVPQIKTGTFAQGCNVEFWDCNYATKNATSIPGASGDRYDFGDEISSGDSPGHGSMQVHHFQEKQTIFSFSGFGKGSNAEVGIGNCPEGSHPDWTFTSASKFYSGGQMIVLVEME